MKIKQLLAVMSVSVLIAANAMPVYAFTDVPETFWGHEIITNMQDEGHLTEIIKSDGKFAPNEAITRGDFVALIMKACANGQKGNLNMEDAGTVRENIRPYLGAAQEMGIFMGMADKNNKLFAKADSLITRQEAATMLGRLLKTKVDAPIEFDDSEQIAKYAVPYVSAMSITGVIRGYENNTFAPKGNLTRAEAVSLINYAQTFAKLNKAELKIYTGGLGYKYLDGALNKAIFQQPEGVAVDKSGNLIICDTGNNLIRKAANNNISTVAGKISARNAEGYALGTYRDDKVGEAGFNKPVDAVVNSAGDIIIADSANNSIRIIKNDTVYNYCGNGKAGYKNDAKQSAQFNLPSGITLDKSGNLYVADTLNHCIRKVDKDRNVTLFAGTPQTNGYKDGKAEEALFNEPVGVAVAEDGTVYVADSGNQRIRAVKDGNVSTVAGTGSEKDADTGYYLGGYLNGDALSAKFMFPQGICLTDEGDLIIADTGNNVIRALLKNGKVTTVAGCGIAGNLDGAALTAKMNKPTDVVYKDGQLYIADALNSSVRVLNLNLSDFQ